MPTKPTLYPQWARLDQVDPTSLQNNVIEPPNAYKEYGWNYQEKPARNFFNWLGRIVYNWVEHFDANLARVASLTVAASDTPEHAKEAADYICDGTDDQVEIQAAIDLLHGGGLSGTIQLMEGNYSISDSITLKTGVRLVGSGKYSTVLRVVQDASTAFPVLDVTSAIAAGIELLGIDSNTQAAHGHTGIQFDLAVRCMVRDVAIQDMKDPVAEAGKGRGIFFTTNKSEKNTLENVEVNDCATVGIELDTTSEINKFIRCTVQGCDQGIRIQGIENVISQGLFDSNTLQNVVFPAGGGQDCKLIDSYIKSSGTGYSGVYILGGTRIDIRGCVFKENAKHGIEVAYNGGSGANGVRTDSNTFIDNSQDGANTFDAIYFDTDGGMIQNNVIRGANHRYAVNVDTNGDNVWTSDNDAVGGFTTAAYNMAGTGYWPGKPQNSVSNPQLYTAVASGGPVTHAVDVYDMNNH